MDIYNNNSSTTMMFDDRRMRSGVLMVLFVLVAANVPSPIFGFSVLICAGWLSFLEWSELCFEGDSGKKNPYLTFIITCVLFKWPGGWLESLSDGALNFTVMLALCLACSAVIVLAALQMGSPGERCRQIMQVWWLRGMINPAVFLIGVVIQLAAWECMITTHKRGAGGWLFWICLVALVDCVGYLVGKSIDSKKGAVTVSPNKTVAGTIAMVAVPFFGFFWLWAEPPMTYAVLVGMIALWGDLWLSLIKRVKGVKDTGQIIPGHGGVLDRLDSHLMVWGLFGVVREARY